MTEPHPPPATPADRAALRRNWRAFAAITLAAGVLRWQALGDPFSGFDEQFYLLMGDRMLHGAVPYVDLFDRKPVGLFLIYAGARALGGEGFIQYQLIALGFASGSAFLLWRAVLRRHGHWSAANIAVLYLVWLNFMEGEGGQAEVLFNLPMIGAALLVWHAWDARTSSPVHGTSAARGAAAMLLVGIALQIKYTVIFEGVYFGAVLIAAQYLGADRPRAPAVRRTAALALVWMACAGLPTALAALWYWQRGSFDAFVFANLWSGFGRRPVAADLLLWGAAKQVAILALLLIPAALAWQRGNGRSAFLIGWLGTGVLGIVVLRDVLSPHYAIALLPPLLLLIAPLLRDQPARRIALAALALVAALSQIVLFVTHHRFGGADQAQALARAAQPRDGCLYVYDGPPALYLLTHACLPTRYAFPGHLNTAEEGSTAALGVDPAAEVSRIMASQPEVVVDVAPAFERGNRATRAVLGAALARDYRLTARLPRGDGSARLVYRRIADLGP